jgi:hypothetical protein
VVCALTTPFGGAKAAGAALAMGAGVYALGAHAWDWETPYLASLAAAFVVYGLIGVEGRRAEPLADA